MSRVLEVIAWVTVGLAAALVAAAAGIFLYLDPQVPSAASYRNLRLETPLRMYTSSGKLIAEFGERRLIPQTLAEIPPLFLRAVIDTEDKRFYDHAGVDVIGAVGALFDFVLAGGEVGDRGGASTITQQLARMVSLSREQVFIRKFREMLLALKIERELSKDAILELYVNVSAYGKRAYGPQAAAFTYYGKPLQELSLAEMAMLAGIPNRPTLGNPINNPTWALARRNVVLARMLEQGSIDQAAYEAAAAAPDTAALHETPTEVSAPYAAEWARQTLFEKFGRDLYVGGLVAELSIDADMQAAAVQAVRGGIIRYDRYHGFRGPEQRVDVDAMSRADLQALLRAGDDSRLRLAVVTALRDREFDVMLGDGRVATIGYTGFVWASPLIDANARGARPERAADVVARGDVVRVSEHADGFRLEQWPEVQAALVALDPKDGAVRAMVGGFDFSRVKFNHAMQSGRQPGSSFKPFVYSAALDKGLSPDSTFLNAPLVLNRGGGELFRPSNFDDKFSGPMRLRDALAKSVNLVSMRLLLAIGAGYTRDYVARFGFDVSTFPPDTQLAVGGGTIAISPLAMARANAVFANGGYLVEPHIVRWVRRADDSAVVDAPQYPTVCEECEEAAVFQDDPAQARSLDDLLVPPAPRVLDEYTAYRMNQMLGEVMQRGTGSRSRVLGRSDLRGKTGTTNKADVWFNGFNRDLVAVVWLGFSDSRPIGDRETGSSAALPIWVEFAQTALAGMPERLLEEPSRLLRMRVDDRGRLAAPREPRDPNSEPAGEPVINQGAGVAPGEIF